MKNLITISIIALLLPLALQAQSSGKKTTQDTQQERPHLVVFVVGLRNAPLSDYLTNLIENNLSRTYLIIPRTEAVKKKMQELKDYEDGGQVDDRELIEWGHQHNIQTLCLVTVAHTDEFLFSAQLTDVKTNTLIGNAEYEIPSLTGDDLKKAASALAGQMQNQLKNRK
ncbi:MAG: hypothetical protein FWD60_04505 [Candidatus Azobacteroides sp.]|nr:hypothetical protein [Candidatus Azobacteroides sp.]